MQSYNYYMRDAILFFILLLLVQYFIIDTLPHKKLPLSYFTSLHIDDSDDIKFLEALKHDKELLKKIVKSNTESTEYETLLELYSVIVSIEKEYTHVSPGLALLGPFSILYLEIKQRELREQVKQLMKMVVHQI